MLANFNKWQGNSAGLLMYAVLEFVIAYIFASLSINTGSLWLYLLTLIFFIAGLKNLFKLFGTIIHVRNKTS